MILIMNVSIDAGKRGTADEHNQPGRQGDTSCLFSAATESVLPGHLLRRALSFSSSLQEKTCSGSA